MTLSRRTVMKGGAAGALAAAAPGIRDARAASDTKIMHAVMQGDLRSFDPIWTTANITANYGAMVYDTLVSMDADYKPQPQMVGKWELSDLLADGKKGWFGWRENTEYEALRKQWALVPTAAERLAIAQKMQKLAWSFVPLVPLGQWVSSAAMRPSRAASPNVADRCANER